MNSPRRRAREMALKALYQADIAKNELATALNQVLDETYYEPAIEQIAREFIKNSQANEILSGDVESFLSYISGGLSLRTDATRQTVKDQVNSCLDKFFPGLTVTDSSKPEVSGLIKKLVDKKSRNKGMQEFAEQIIDFISQNQTRIDKLIEDTAQNWSLERMSSIDRCILRAAVCEFLYFPDIPANATINEAVELAKKYSSDRSYEFVNGILDKICKAQDLQKSKSESLHEDLRKSDALADNQTEKAT